jgi:predicted GNAT family N-acyltransferase
MGNNFNIVDITQNQLFQNIRQTLNESRQGVARSINSAMVQAYWQIGRLIVEDEQKGRARAKYGEQQLEQLSQLLKIEYGKGFDITNLRNMRKFYLVFPIQDAVRLELSWTHSITVK